MTEPSTTIENPTELLEFLYRLGQAYLACGEQTAQVELQLRRIAAAYGARRSRVVAFPTALFISLHDGAQERVTLAEGPLQTLRLDQMADVYTLGAAAQRGEVELGGALQELSAIVRRPRRFGVVGALIGHTIIAVGIAMVLNPTMLNVAVTACLGAMVGALRMLGRDRPMLSVHSPVIAAASVSAAVFLAIGYGLKIDPLDVLIPPLVTFLPGAMLTFGMIELAYGDMVSGAARLITGFVQLVLLAFGLAAGAALVGVELGAAPDFKVPIADVPWAPWMGVVVFGLGVSLHYSAPKNALPWMLLVLLLAFLAQRLAAGQFGTQFSGFFGSLVATPLVYLIQLRFRGPPPMVTFLPAFWLMVPGSLGLLSVKRMLSNTTEGLEGLMSTVFVFASIAMGTLLGASLYKWFTETFGAWQLQIGRVGRKPSPKK